MYLQASFSNLRRAISKVTLDSRAQNRTALFFARNRHVQRCICLTLVQRYTASLPWNIWGGNISENTLLSWSAAAFPQPSPGRKGRILWQASIRSILKTCYVKAWYDRKDELNWIFLQSERRICYIQDAHKYRFWWTMQDRALLGKTSFFEVLSPEYRLISRALNAGSYGLAVSK